MIDFEGKPLEELNMMECVEFEKQMLKKVLAASKAQMGEGLVDQINMFIELIRDHKRQIAQSAMYSKDEKQDGTVLDFMCMTMIDPATSWFEIVELPVIEKPTKKGKVIVTAEVFDKTSRQIARLVNKSWFSRYPRCKKCSVRQWK